MELKKLHRKGVSPLVATVLLVALTIAAFLAIFAWSKGFIKEGIEKNNGPIEGECQSISFDAVLQQGGNLAYVTNKGNVVIYAFNIKGENDGTTKLFWGRTDTGKLGIGEVDNLDLSSIVGKYSKITLIPVLLGRGTNSGTGKVFPCNEMAKVITGG
jgi:flagellin-like protein